MNLTEHRKTKLEQLKAENKELRARLNNARTYAVRELVDRQGKNTQSGAAIIHILDGQKLRPFPTKQASQ
jgi:hypothetical protein